MFAAARAVADAVLYEGYVLYPYRASSTKNAYRWQFGVVVPPAWGRAGTSEPSRHRTEVVVESVDADTQLHVTLRFLHARARVVTDRDGRAVASLATDSGAVVAWDEATEREVCLTVPLDGLDEWPTTTRFSFDGDRAVEEAKGSDGRIVGLIERTLHPVCGSIAVTARPVPGPWRAVTLRVDVANESSWDNVGAGRDEALRRSLVGTHALLGVEGGRFVSPRDPPEWARGAVAACRQEHTWPVLVGDEEHPEVVLSSPIILPDHPEIAPESAANLYDGTEIDEILTLRTMALTDEEKAAARATDPRAAAVIEHAEHLPPEWLERLHGTVRSVDGVRTARPLAPSGDPGDGDVPWWDPDADQDVDPAADRVRVGDVTVGAGDQVRLRPRRAADAQDMFLAGRTATVQAVLSSVDGDEFLAVSLDDDPAADLQVWQGRFRYFSPDEVEPLRDPASPQGDKP